ncbi:MAG: DNA alkylation repair protein [Patescibacteria group bacterium]|jgi:3-methyladenine DNA glycosylase AlkD
MPSFISEFKDFLLTSENPKNAEAQKRYLYSNLKHYGLTTKQNFDFIKKYNLEFQALSKQHALGMAQKLWDKRSYEERGAGLYIVSVHSDTLDIKDMPWIERWMRECGGWALLDGFIIPFMPKILTKDKSVYSYLKKWIKDDDYWVRRSALLAQLLLFRDNQGGDKRLFFDMAKSQFDESWIDKVYITSEDKKRARFFIRKAIGWTLREMGRKDPEGAFTFLKENKDKMSGLSFRDGSRRLPKSYKDRL